MWCVSELPTMYAAAVLTRDVCELGVMRERRLVDSKPLTLATNGLRRKGCVEDAVEAASRNGTTLPDSTYSRRHPT